MLPIAISAFEAIGKSPSDSNRFTYCGLAFIVSELGPAGALSLTEFCHIRLRRAARCLALIETGYRSRNIHLELDVPGQAWTWTFWSSHHIANDARFAMAEALILLRNEVIASSESEVPFCFSPDEIFARRTRLHGHIRALIDATSATFEYPNKSNKRRISLLLHQSSVPVEMAERIVERIAMGTLSSSAVDGICDCCDAESELIHFVSKDDHYPDVIASYGDLIAQRKSTIDEMMERYFGIMGWLDHSGDYLAALKNLAHHLDDENAWPQDLHIATSLSDLTKEWMGQVFWSIFAVCGGNQDILRRAAARFSRAVIVGISHDHVARLEGLIRRSKDAYINVLGQSSVEDINRHGTYVVHAFSKLSPEVYDIAFTMACWASGCNDQDDWVVVCKGRTKIRPQGGVKSGHFGGVAAAS